MLHNTGLPYTATAMFTTPRLTRVYGEFRSMGRSLAEFVGARHHLAELGTDPLVCQLASERGFARHDLVIRRMVAVETLITIVVVPSRIWCRMDERAELRALRAEARRLRTACVLVPHRILTAPKRGAASRVVGRCRNIQLTVSQESKLLVRTSKDVGTTIGECAAAIPDHPDPVGAVLGLVARGELKLDRCATLDLATLVRRASQPPLIFGERP